METKVCRKCGEEKNSENFPHNKNHCLECNRAYYKEYYKKNKEVITGRQKVWTANNRETVNKKERRWYSNNKDKADKQKERWKASNKPKVLEIQRNYYHNSQKHNVQWRITNSLRTRVRAAIKGSYKSDKTTNLLSCSIPELIKHLEQQFTSGMSWDNYGEWHIDHIKPCASFDLTKEEQQRKCFHYSNLQPLWAIDNIKKGDKVL